MLYPTLLGYVFDFSSLLTLHGNNFNSRTVFWRSESFSGLWIWAISVKHPFKKLNFKWRFSCRIKQRSWWDWAAENFGPISAYLNMLNDDNILGWINHHQMTSYQVLNLLKILGRLFIISKMLLDNGSIDPFWAEDLFNWSDNLLRAYLIPSVVRNSVRTYLARSMVRK